MATSRTTQRSATDTLNSTARPAAQDEQVLAAAGLSVVESLGSRSYVLDTSVLLSDPRAITRFAEHEVILPIVVITELEGKRHDPELGYFARKALRLLDELRVKHNGLNQAIPLGTEGGTLRVELNHVSTEVLPVGFRSGDNDSRILAVAKSLSDEGRNVTVVSKDLPMRVKASAMGLQADEYRNELVKDSGWTGVAELDTLDDDVDTLYTHEPVFLPDAAELPANTGVILHSGKGSALGRVGADKQVRLVRGDRDVFGLHGRSAEQRLAIDLLMDPEVG
ncbi:MAG: PIN domain-containing protein, partial [Actinomycetes bacterium]